MVMGQPARTPWWSRAAVAAGSIRSLVALGLPLAAVALLAAAGSVDGEAALASWTVRAWAGAGVIALAFAGIRAGRAGRWEAVLLVGAVLFAGGQLAWARAFRFEATYDLGEGERSVPERPVVAGPLARAPQLGAVSLPAGREGVARLSVGSQIVVAQVGRAVALPEGLVAEVDGVFAAPWFQLARTSGAIEGSGLLKLVPGERQYFQVAVLPHRFYVTLPRPPDGTVGPAAPFTLEIYRGKILLHRDQAASLGAQPAVEGLVLSLDEGGRWARIRVRRVRGHGPLVAAALLALGSALVALAKARRGGARG